MNQFSQNVKIVNQSGWGCGLSVLGLVVLISLFGVKWIINSIAVLVVISVVAPVLGFLGLRWWLSRHLIESDCPSCHYPFTGFENQDCRCPNCGESLSVINGKFQRPTPPGTIDVDAVEVGVNVLED